MPVKGKKGAVKTWSTPAGEEERRPIPCALCAGTEFVPALTCEGFTYVRCVHCGLVQINPQPAARAVANRYQEAFGNDYLAYEIANEQSFLRLQELALSGARFDKTEKEYFGLSAPANSGAIAASADSGAIAAGRPRILDVGCATGALLAKLRERGWLCKGVEISPSAGYARRERNLDVSVLPLEENSFPPGSFEVVLASHLIEHLNRPAGFVREVYRILVPGGRLFITTPNISGLQAKIFGGAWRSAIFDHLYLFSVRTLSLLLKEAGFSVELVTTWGGLAAGTAPVPVKRIADIAAKKLGFGDVMMIRAKKNAESGPVAEAYSTARR
jgi:SAM-dependent methyltransferase